MPRPKRLPVIGALCVACGSCANACPVGALSVPKGIRAEVDTDKCVGCAKCERVCPAGVIVMEETADA